MGTWMTHFHTLLVTDNKLLQTEVSCFEFRHMSAQWHRCIVLLCAGRGRSGSARASQVGHLRQRGHVRTEVRRGVLAASASVRASRVEPAHQHRQAGQVRPGECLTLQRFTSSFVTFNNSTCFSLLATPFSSWHPWPSDPATSSCSKIQPRCRAFVRRSSFQIWSSEVTE